MAFFAFVKTFFFTKKRLLKFDDEFLKYSARRDRIRRILPGWWKAASVKAHVALEFAASLDNLLRNPICARTHTSSTVVTQ